MIPVHVALVDESGLIDPQQLAVVAGALNEQVQADFRRAWTHVPRATVAAYPRAPADTWAIRVQRTLDEPGALGYHTDDHGQPYALVQHGSDWTVTASHELLEMLADPFGNMMHQARMPAGLQGEYARVGLAHPSSRVAYLLEVGDPPEATSYEVGGVEMSDFVYPDWYRTNPPVGARFSHAGGCTGARQVAPGGYVSFMVPTTRSWWQAFNVRGGLRMKELGRFDRAAHGSLRAFADFHAGSDRRPR